MKNPGYAYAGDDTFDVVQYFLINLSRFEINACPRQPEIASGKLFFDLTCPTSKLTKYSVLNNIKQDFFRRAI